MLGIIIIIIIMLGIMMGSYRPISKGVTKTCRRQNYKRDVNTLLLRRVTVVGYKLLYKPMANVVGKGDFRPLTAEKPLNKF